MTQDLNSVMSETQQTLVDIDAHSREVKKAVLAYLSWHSGYAFSSGSGSESELRASIVDDYGQQGLERMTSMGLQMGTDRNLAVSSLFTQIRESENILMPVCHLDVESFLSQKMLPLSEEQEMVFTLPEDIEISGLSFDSYETFRHYYNSMGTLLITSPNTVFFMLQKFENIFLEYADPCLEQRSRFHRIKPEGIIVNAPTSSSNSEANTERSFQQIAHATDVGRLVTIKGQVIEVGEVRAVLSHVAFRCISKDEFDETCGNVVLVHQNTEENVLLPPGTCPTCQGKSFQKLDSSESRTVSLQRFVIQEETIGGDARSLMVELRGTLVNKINPGTKVKITGIVRLEALAKSSLICSQYISASSIIETSSSEASIYISDKDREDALSFKESTSLSKRMEMMTDTWAGHIHGSEEIKKAIILQNCGSPADDVFLHRPGIHIMIVGDPGTAKTKFLQLSRNLNPNNRYTSADSMSQSGITGGCDQVEDMYTGKRKWAVIPGELGLTPVGAVCSIDEFNLYKGDYGDFNNALESGEVKITKIAKATISTKCSVLAGANPSGKSAHKKKFNRDDEIPYFDQIDLDFTTTQRFDAIFILEDEADMEHDEKIALAMLSSMTEGKGSSRTKNTFTIENVNKYLAICRTLPVKLNEEASNHIASEHASKRNNATNPDSLRSHRQVASIMRFTTAVARFDMSEVATIDHVLYAEKILETTLQERDPGVMEGKMLTKDAVWVSKIDSTIIDILKTATKDTQSSFDKEKKYPTKGEITTKVKEIWKSEFYDGDIPDRDAVTARLSNLTKGKNSRVTKLKNGYMFF